jgi:hypothetical protein
MGIDYHDARMLLEARLRGASFENTATVAHLALNLHPAEIASLQRLYRAGFPSSTAQPLENYQFGDYSDQFLGDALGVTALTIIDYSPYEGANLVHDLNQPVPEDLWGRFDSVIEAGSLEHIFNFPVAITSLMKMVKVGGRIFITTPANNLCGHGFYQFSPEVMFRIFTEENGFELNRVALLEATYPQVSLIPKRKAYEVADPARVRSRVGLVSKRPVMMMVEARKTSDVLLFARPPLQDSYVTRWNTETTRSPSTRLERVLKSALGRLPGSLRARIRGNRALRRFSFSNGRFYKSLQW